MLGVKVGGMGWFMPWTPCFPPGLTASSVCSGIHTPCPASRSSVRLKGGRAWELVGPWAAQCVRGGIVEGTRVAAQMLDERPLRAAHAGDLSKPYSVPHAPCATELGRGLRRLNGEHGASAGTT